MATDQDLDFAASNDFSSRNAPDAWFEAAAHAPKAPPGSTRRADFTVVPVSASFDLFTACMLALTVSGLFGAGWYLAEIWGGIVSPWPALGLAALLSVAIRFGAGRHEREARAALASVFYVVTLVVVVILQARHAYVDIYGSTANFSLFEQELLHTRLADPWNVTAWVLGLLLAMRLSLSLGVRH